MSIKLSPPVEAFFLANQGTGEFIAECFTSDAVVRDEGRTHRGVAENHQWRAGVAAQFTYTCEPLKVEHENDSTTVTCHLEGDFPGNTIDLRFIFGLAGDKIATLEIVP